MGAGRDGKLVGNDADPPARRVGCAVADAHDLRRCFRFVTVAEWAVGVGGGQRRLEDAEGIGPQRARRSDDDVVARELVNPQLWCAVGH